MMMMLHTDTHSNGISILIVFKGRVSVYCADCLCSQHAYECAYALQVNLSKYTAHEIHTML
jgi:hypothetical protein